MHLLTLGLTLQNLNSTHSANKQGGFTLIEVLVSISIFAVLSLAAYQVLQGVLKSGELSKKHSEQLVEIQRAMLLIEKDFSQIVARQSRVDGQDSEDLRVLTVGKNIFESSDQALEFSRLGWLNPLGALPRSNILRVRYRVYEEKLQRLYFLYPDIVSGQEPEEHTLLTGIESLSFRFWDNGWKDNWTKNNRLPAGIEISFTSKQFGEISRRFVIAKAEVVK